MIMTLLSTYCGRAHGWGREGEARGWGREGGSPRVGNDTSIVRRLGKDEENEERRRKGIERKKGRGNPRMGKGSF